MELMPPIVSARPATGPDALPVLEMSSSPCTICGDGDDAGGIQHCDGGCNRPFHHDGNCALLFLGKAFSSKKMRGDIICVDCSKKTYTPDINVEKVPTKAG